ncbi:MAG: DUF87 domain-containing protein, partial [Candidatus Helarchaeota archaeon]|nr:DUF87 domain-containing protein [Candidatus Helarchaeota archaeon]
SQLLKSTGIDFIQYNKDYYISNLPDPYLAKEMIFTRNYLHEGLLVPLNGITQFSHFPTENMLSSQLFKIGYVNNSIPSDKFINSNGTVIGYYEELDKKFPVFLSLDLKRHHTYIIGSTGSGKSVLLQNMIKSDLNNNQGLCVIDPHGDLARAVIGLVPENRMDDVIYFNPADEEYAPCFNILNLGLEKYEACNCLMDVFKAIFTDWSYRQLEIIRFCLLALLEKSGTKIKNILDILLNKKYRENLVAKITDPLVKEWWQGFGRFSKDAGNPISYKINMFCTTPLISSVINQSDNKIDIFDILKNGKILIADLPKGKLGNEYSRLLGTLIVSLFQVAALKREKISEALRKDFTI